MNFPGNHDPLAPIPAREAAARLREASGVFAHGPALGAFLRQLESMGEAPIPGAIVALEFGDRLTVDKVLALRN